MLTIDIRDGGTWFKPGQNLEGSVSWRLEREVESIEVRLFWYTSGKGSRDVEVVATRNLVRPDLAGSEAIAFTIPRGPYSFSGKLITLAWAIEAVALPGGETERLDLQIGPTPVEVDV